jgi:8-oxo-dGTP pyrophosphatase MutT (NUDIX family)
MSHHVLMQIVQQAIILNRQGQILILLRPEGVWQFAGGRLEEGERWDDGLRREVSEETGITDLEIVSVLMVDNFEWQSQQLYSAYFLCRTPATAVQLSPEHVEYRWLNRDDDLRKISFWHDNLRTLAERVLLENL